MASLEYRVNGQPLEGAEHMLPATVRDELAKQGWELSSIRVDDRVVDAATISDFDVSGSRVVEFIAQPPSGEGVPTEATFDEMRAGLTAAIPQFAKLANELGECFARGEWSKNLTRLSHFLEELELTSAGFHVAGFADDYDDVIERLPEAIRGLSGFIEEQSWVEVSDTLLYELLPLLEDWQAKLPTVQD